MRSCERIVFNFLTGRPTEEERNPPPFTLTIAGQLDRARTCLALNIPSDLTIIKASFAGAVTMATLAAALMLRMDMLGAGGDPQDDAISAAEARLAGGAVMALMMAVFCVVACLYATVRHCLSTPPPDVHQEDA